MLDEEEELEATDTVGELGPSPDVMLEILRQRVAQPNKFASIGEQDEDDINEFTPEEIEANPGKKLLWASENGLKDIVESLLTSYPDIIGFTDADGYTALHRACYSDHLDVAEMLMERGSSVSATTNDGWEPLHSACRWNSARCATLLLHNGANPNALTNGHLTPLHLASSNRDAYDCMVLLLGNRYIDTSIKNKAGDTAYDVALRSGKFATLFDCVDPNVMSL